MLKYFCILLFIPSLFAQEGRQVVPAKWEKEYQEIIHTLRSRTTAEVAIVSDHPGAKE